MHLTSFGTANLCVKTDVLGTVLLQKYHLPRLYKIACDRNRTLKDRIIYYLSGLLWRVLPDFSWNNVLFLAFISPLSEEVVFRGFAFGQIRRHANWGFWQASIIPAVVFGLGHLGINQDLGQSVGVFLVTGVGGILFAWIYEKWDYNLWAPFWIHCLMNLNWNVFDVGNSAFAGWFPTTLQVIVILAAIILTVFKKRIPLLSDGGQ